MKGSVQIHVRNVNITFKFTLERNISIISGNSATGKTTLVDMIEAHEELGAESGVFLKCDYPCVVLSGVTWKEKLRSTKNSVVFIDETSSFVETKEFAERIAKSSNYYVIVTRKPLFHLPYSIDAIYEIRKNKRYPHLVHAYQNISIDDISDFNFDILITEDKKSGYQFYEKINNNKEMVVVSAGGKSNLLAKLEEYEKKKIVVVADGAALGPEISKLVQYQTERKKDIFFFLPESFEWLILKSGIINQADIQTILQNPIEYIESEKYISWERFFTALLIDRTKTTEHMKYSKSKLKPFYTSEGNAQRILHAMNSDR